MIRRTALILLLTILATGVARHVCAQDVRPGELSTKEQRQRDRDERRKLKREYKEKLRHIDDPVVKTAPVIKKKIVLEYPQTTLKGRYRIDVLMQMYLDDLVKGSNVTYKDKIPDKAQPGMAFYQGLNMAADSLKKAGFKIDIYVHDIASAAERPDMLVSKGILDSADLIIGAVPASDIAVIAEFANNKHINFISALAPSDGGVKNVPYLTILQPTLRTHCEWIATDVISKCAGQKVMIYYRKSVEPDSSAWKYIVNADDINKVDTRKISCKTLPAPEKIKDIIDSGKNNVVILPVLDNIYADSILAMLSANFPQSHFEIYGMPTWVNTKKRSFPNISIHTTAPFSFDMASASAKYVARTYKKDYGGKPPELVYRGYEAMFWYANLLRQYGTIFNEHYSDNSTTPFTRFEVKPRWDKDGNILYNENTHVYLSSSDSAVH